MDEKVGQKRKGACKWWEYGRNRIIVDGWDGNKKQLNWGSNRTYKKALVNRYEQALTRKEARATTTATSSGTRKSVDPDNPGPDKIRTYLIKNKMTPRIVRF